MLDVGASVGEHQARDFGTGLEAKVEDLELGVGRVEGSSLGKDSGGGLGSDRVGSHCGVRVFCGCVKEREKERRLWK